MPAKVGGPEVLEFFEMEMPAPGLSCPLRPFRKSS
jgi:hypothetical protein